MAKKRSTKPKAAVEGQAATPKRKGTSKRKAKTPEQVKAAAERKAALQQKKKAGLARAKAKATVQKAKTSITSRSRTGPQAFQELLGQLDDALRSRDKKQLAKLVEPIKNAAIADEYREELKKVYKRYKGYIYLAEQASGSGVEKSKMLARLNEKMINSALGGRGKTGGKIVMNKGFQINVIMNMLIARGIDPDTDLFDGWSDWVDPTLTPEENILNLLQEAASMQGEGEAKIIQFLGPTLKQQERMRRKAETTVQRLAKEHAMSLPDDWQQFIEIEAGSEQLALAKRNLARILGGGQPGALDEDWNFVPEYQGSEEGAFAEGEEEGTSWRDYVSAPRLPKHDIRRYIGRNIPVPVVTQRNGASCGLAAAMMAFVYKSWPAAKLFLELGGQLIEKGENYQDAVMLGMCNALLLVRHRPQVVAKLQSANLYTGFIRAQNAALQELAKVKKLQPSINIYKREHVVLPALVRAYYDRTWKTNHELHVIAWMCGFNLEHHDLSDATIGQVARLVKSRKAMLVGCAQSHWVTVVGASPGNIMINDPDPSLLFLSSETFTNFVERRNAVFYVYGRLAIKQLKTRPAMLAEKPAKPLKKPDYPTDASIKKRLAAISARMDELTRLAADRAAKADDGARGRNPAGVDWMSSEELQELEALKHEHSVLDHELKGDVHERVAIKHELSNLKFNVDKDASMNELHAALEKARAIAKKRKERLHEAFVFMTETKRQPNDIVQERHVVFADTLQKARKQVEEKLFKQYREMPHRAKLVERSGKAVDEAWQSFKWGN